MSYSFDASFHPPFNSRILDYWCLLSTLFVTKFFKGCIANHTDTIVIGDSSPLFETGGMDPIDACTIVDKEFMAKGHTWIQTDKAVP